VPYAGMTPYVRVGNWPVVTLCVILFVLSLWAPGATSIHARNVKP
jgi:apolipoprotein N-acyltransferase